jgi:hypothetical protein
MLSGALLTRLCAQLNKYLKLDQKGSIIAEYVWIDSEGGTRAKARVSLPIPFDLLLVPDPNMALSPPASGLREDAGTGPVVEDSGEDGVITACPRAPAPKATEVYLGRLPQTTVAVLVARNGPLANYELVLTMRAPDTQRQGRCSL